MIFVTLVFEDDLSEAVMIRILNEFPEKYSIFQSYSGNGFGYLKTNIKGFNQASVVNPHFMLTDLDRYECPIALKNDWIDFELNNNFIFRIAVREVESWVLSDREGLSSYFNVALINFPNNPDNEMDPKNTLIQLAKRSKKGRLGKISSRSIKMHLLDLITMVVCQHLCITNGISQMPVYTAKA